MKLKIETFSWNHYDRVFDIWKRAGIVLGPSDEKAELSRMIERNPNLFLIGAVNGKIMSVVAGGFDGRRGYVHHLAVDPEYQKRGYGKMLMNELLRRFRDMGVYKVHLFIHQDNKSVINFYQSLGWEKRDDLIMMSKYPTE
jgi:ribosomal protein S18 acetylase RimI-like enzyme